MREQELQENLTRVRERITAACQRVDRSPDEVTLVAVSKTFPADDLRVLYEQGVRDFGESYVQEWQEKSGRLPDDIRWHIIGHLQSNKVRYLDDSVALVHSADRKSVLKKLHGREHAPEDILLQVNLGGEDSKSGVDPGGLFELLDLAQGYESLRVRGLMAIPPPVDAPEDNRPHFQKLAGLLASCQQRLRERGELERSPCSWLSMGMTADFEIAVEEGATHVRVGSALFGHRPSGGDP